MADKPQSRKVQPFKFMGTKNEAVVMGNSEKDMRPRMALPVEDGEGEPMPPTVMEDVELPDEKPTKKRAKKEEEPMFASSDSDN